MEVSRKLCYCFYPPHSAMWVHYQPMETGSSKTLDNSLGCMERLGLEAWEATWVGSGFSLLDPVSRPVSVL